MQESFDKNAAAFINNSNSKSSFSIGNHHAIKTKHSPQKAKTLSNLTNNKVVSLKLSEKSVHHQIHPYKSHVAKSSMLTDLLKSDELLPYVLSFNCSEKNNEPVVNNKFYISNLLGETNSSPNRTEEPSSHNLSDYIEVIPEHTKQMEKQATDNSLFLAVARSLLFKVYFVDKNYEKFLKIFCFDAETQREGITLDSDLALQEILRKKLCLYWLGFVVEGAFQSANCKYAK